MSREDSFLRRWSDRKQHARDADAKPDAVETAKDDITDSSEPGSITRQTGPSVEAPSDDLSSVDLSSDDPATENLEVVSEDAAPAEEHEAIEPLLTDEDMPAITTLSATSDLTGFFNRGVSASLRRAALRHVFQLPVYNIRDGLNDYDEDFTNFEPLGDIVTSDMKFHAARKERERLEREKLEQEARLAEESTQVESEGLEEDSEQHAESESGADGETVAENEDSEVLDASDSAVEQAADELETPAVSQATDNQTTDSRVTEATSDDAVDSDKQSEDNESDALLPS